MTIDILRALSNALFTVGVMGLIWYVCDTRSKPALWTVLGSSAIHALLIAFAIWSIDGP